jgi:hypothetical protein
MKDLIDTTRDKLEDLAEYRTGKPGKPKRLPIDAETASVEDIVSYAMFEYYARLYASNQELTREQLCLNVAENFKKDPGYVSNMYEKNRWYTRARKLLFDNDKSNLPTECNTILDKMIGDAATISSLGTRLISDYLVNAKYSMLTPRDIFKLGMLVVECSRLAGELNGTGKTGIQNANMVKLVINE